MARQFERYDVWQYRQGGDLVPGEDDITCEEPLEIRVAGRSVSVTMRTPGDDEALAVGFLVGEGMLGSRADIAHVRRCESEAGTLVDVLVAPHVVVDLDKLTRHVFASSSCGVCGLATIEAIRRRWPPLKGGPVVSIDRVESLGAALLAAQPTFQRTGGLHAAGLFAMAEDGDIRLLRVCEDIGRHNAVDKIIGHAMLDGALPLNRHALMVSGRASFEIVQKAIAAGITFVVAVSAPSSLAIDLARESNVTLIGFARAGRCTVYAHPHRVVTAATPSASGSGARESERS